METGEDGEKSDEPSSSLHQYSERGWQWAARGPVSIITTHLVEHLECYYEVELQTKVHTKFRNHGEGLFSCLKADTTTFTFKNLRHCASHLAHLL